jgi:hypothetical protein
MAWSGRGREEKTKTARNRQAEAAHHSNFPPSDKAKPGCASPIRVYFLQRKDARRKET